ncbi:MAG: DUF4363 family protein [Syntrophomonadaceae bacterium]|nr:DUF4363 family protein [Syntrophomonadaceae bacterium]
MRLLVTLVIILTLLISLGTWNNKALRDSTDTITGQIEQVMTAIDGQHWEQAMQQTAKIEKSWHENARWWPVFLDHQEIDNIEFSLAKVKKYVDTRNAPLAQGQLSELHLMLEHIPDKERINLENIF